MKNLGGIKMLYKYVGLKPYILGLNGQKFIKEKIFEETNPKNPFECSKDFKRVKEKKKTEKVKEVKKEEIKPFKKIFKEKRQHEKMD